jgi:hypothetical protein
MTDRDHDPTPTTDPGPVPASVRRAWTVLAARGPVADEAALDAHLATVADPDADEEARLAAIEAVLEQPGGSEALAILAAARRAVPPATDQALAESAAPALGVVRGDAPRRPPAPVATPRPRALPRWAVAAALVAVVAGTSVVLGGRGTDAVPDADPVRAGERALLLVGPRGDLAAPPTRLAWRALAGRPRYTVELLDAADAPVMLVETTDTTAAIPAGTLRPGSYRWFVRARATDGTDLRSALERFTIR